MARRDWWKHLPQHRRSKFWASGQGMFLPAHVCMVSLLFLQSRDVMAISCMYLGIAHYKYLFLMLMFSLSVFCGRIHSLDWPTSVQHVTSIHFYKCGSTTWTCAGASISVTTRQQRHMTLSQVPTQQKKIQSHPQFVVLSVWKVSL